MYYQKQESNSQKMIKAEIVPLHTLRVKKNVVMGTPTNHFLVFRIKNFALKIYITSLVSTS